MVGDVGVEVGPARLHHHLAQQAGGGELMQAVVDGGQRDAHVVGHRLGMQLLGGDVAVAAAGGLEQQLGERQALTSRTQSGRLEALRSEEHTSELQSLMRISYAVFCLKKKT